MLSSQLHGQFLTCWLLENQYKSKYKIFKGSSLKILNASFPSTWQFLIKKLCAKYV